LCGYGLLLIGALHLLHLVWLAEIQAAVVKQQLRDEEMEKAAAAAAAQQKAAAARAAAVQADAAAAAAEAAAGQQQGQEQQLDQQFKRPPALGRGGPGALSIHAWDATVHEPTKWLVLEPMIVTNAACGLLGFAGVHGEAGVHVLFVGMLCQCQRVMDTEVMCVRVCCLQVWHGSAAMWPATNGQLTAAWMLSLV
jgi:hypothetical protein